ncbi:hypothetical protein MAR_034080 [Mya arenaria]|uniref:Uncharacterized protein n=1 Tax=Mya arenaria TaxID=6604 RepID=A0ABY7GE56_MYAAR|nr:hypothetical protein MAR_034080 [Mya arenaria]
MFGKSTLSVTAGYRLVVAHLFKLDIEQHVQLFVYDFNQCLNYLDDLAGVESDALYAGRVVIGVAEEKFTNIRNNDILRCIFDSRVMTIDIASDRLKEIRLIKWWLQKDKAHLIEG